MSTGSPKQRRARNGAGAHTNTDVEAPKPRPNISGPTLTSTTRNEPGITITTNPLGTTRFSNEPSQQNQLASQPRIVLKPTPPRPAKPAEEKEKTTTEYPPPKLRNREWPPKGDKKASLNRVSSPPTVGEPVKPAKPRRPESHAGILDKRAVPPPPKVGEAAKPVRPAKPRRPESHAGILDKPQPLKPVKPRRPESHAGILDKPTVPPAPSSKLPGEKKDTDGRKAPASQPKVPSRPPLRGVDARFPKQSTDERPTSLPLKPSDLKKAGLAAGTKKPSSFSTADNKPKKVPLKPPGPIPPRPGSKPT